MAREYLIPGQGYINETGTREYLIPGQGYLNETVASSAVTALSWLPVYNARVNPALLSAQNTTFAKPITPSPISQTNWYPIYDAQVAAQATAARYNFLSKSITPAPISQTNWYPVYDPKVFLAAPGVSFITPPIPTIATTVTVINWLPNYEAQVKPIPLSAKNSTFAETLATPLSVTNWYSFYTAEVNPPPTAVRYSAISQLLSTPITINYWQSAYAAEVKSAALNSVSITTPPIPTIAAATNPNNWYPSYQAEVKTPKPAPSGAIILPFKLIFPPIPPKPTTDIYGGWPKGRERFPSNIDPRARKQYNRPLVEEDEVAEDDIEIAVEAEKFDDSKQRIIAKLLAELRATNDVAERTRLRNELEVAKRLRAKKAAHAARLDDEETAFFMLMH